MGLESPGTALQRISDVPAETVHWTLSKSAERVTCVERPFQSQIEVCVTYGALTIARRHCKNTDEAIRWSGERRDAWEAYGWKNAKG
jgi:hypothetical protein